LSWKPRPTVERRKPKISLRIALFNSNLFSIDSRLAAEQPVHLAQLNSKLFSLGEYVFSPVQSAIEV